MIQADQSAGAMTVAIFILSVFNGFASALFMFILTDIRSRIVRLEDFKMQQQQGPGPVIRKGWGSI